MRQVLPPPVHSRPNLNTHKNCVVRTPQQVLKEVKALDHAAVSGAQQNGSIVLPCGVEVKAEHLVFELNVKCDAARYGAEIGMSGKMFIALDLTQDHASLANRLSRELTSRVQKLRKSAGLKLDDKVEVFVSPAATQDGASADPAVVQAFVSHALAAHEEEITMKLSGGLIHSGECMSPFATIVAEEVITLANPASAVAEDAKIPATASLRLVVAAPAVVVNKAAVLEACGGDEALAQHAAHTLAMFSFAKMQEVQEIPLQLAVNPKAGPVASFTAKRGTHYFVGQAERLQ